MMKSIQSVGLQSFIIFLLLLSRTLQGQDVIYFDNGDAATDVRLKDVTADKILVQSNSSTKEFSPSKIVLAFRKNGNFLLISELAVDVTQAKQQLQDFLAAPPRTDGNDFLIKAAPLSVIPGKISYESDAVVNYLTAGGNSASISKSELVAILYRDGRHLLIAQVGDAAPLLAEIRPDLANGGKLKAEPAPQPETVQPKADVAATPAPAEPVSAESRPVSGSSKTLTDEERKTYEQKALQKVDEFVSYINIITDKDNSSNDKDRAIEQALTLFLKETTIEVTSLSRAGSRKIPVRQYLLRLKLLPYKYTKIEWVETKFVRDLSQESDGSYWGTIAGQQTFTGYNANGQSLYSDVTDKTTRVKLESYSKVKDGDSKTFLRVMLGNIRVASDQ